MPKAPATDFVILNAVKDHCLSPLLEHFLSG
jgi:hypothetical protein